MSGADVVADTSIRSASLLTAVAYPAPEYAPLVAPPAPAAVDVTRPAVRRTRMVRPFVVALGDALAAAVACLAVAPPRAWLVVPLLWLVLVATMRGYESRLAPTGTEDLRRIVRAGLGLAVAGAALSWVVDLPTQPGQLLWLVAITTGLSLAHRRATASVSAWRRARGLAASHRVLLVGHHHQVAEMMTEFNRSPAHGFEIVGACVHGRHEDESLSVPTTEGLATAADAARETHADAVIVLPCKHASPTAVRRLGWELERSHTQLFVVPGITDVAETRTTVTTVGTVPMLHVRGAELTGWRRLLKETWERTAALLALVVAAPVLLALMLAIRLESPGSPLFKQVRIGRDDKPFTMYKLRSMGVTAEARRAELVEVNEADAVLFKVRDDPRITRVGRLLRRYSLDEVPQLINVVLGHMSLVGPRPPLPSEVAIYEDDVRRRLAVKPGLTGLWQVSGRSDLPWEEAVRLDLRYVDNWSLGLDLSIIARTVRAVVSHQGAY